MIYRSFGHFVTVSKIKGDNPDHRQNHQDQKTTFHSDATKYHERSLAKGLL